jgi:hypothetical protein
MTDDRITILENAQAIISGLAVGVANIWESDLPDDSGVITSRMSATLSIEEQGKDLRRHERVRTGSVFSVGGDRYHVVDVDEGTSSGGSVTLRKLS